MAVGGGGIVIRDRIAKFIKERPALSAFLTIALIFEGLRFVFLPPIIIEGLFLIGAHFALTDSFAPHHILAYIGALLPIVPTIIFGWIVWMQNQKLHDVNTKLHEQNLRISEDIMKHASYNFLLLKEAVIIVTRNYSDSTKLHENKIELKYDGSDCFNEVECAEYDLLLNFEGEAFDKTPIHEVEMESLDFSFLPLCDYAETYGRSRSRFERDYFSWSSVKGYPIPTIKINSEESGSGGKYDFVVQCYIPQYFINDVLTKRLFTMPVITMQVSYVNMLGVKVSVFHTLRLKPLDRLEDRFKIDELTKFEKVDIKKR